MKTIVIAGSIALLGTLLGTRLAILVLVKKGYGQLIRDDGPTSHHVKRGTPTMGGLVIIAAVLLAYFGSHLITFTAPSASALLVLFLFTGLGVVGFLDDYVKISKAHVRPRRMYVVRRYLLILGRLMHTLFSAEE